MYVNEDPWPVAIVSIFLYAALAVVSLYYYLKFRAIKANSLNIRATDSGKYDDPKIAFFLILFISAVLDIPSYIGCLGLSSVHHPRDCEYGAPSYKIFWAFHLVALWGYAFAIVTPPVMWSDIINQKDGRLFFSKYPLDNTKRVFIFLLLSYLLTLLVIVVCALIFLNESVDVEDFQTDNVYYGISLVLEVGITILICIGCLICAVRLQMYVRTVKLNSSMEIKFLFRLNVTLVIVLATYVTKSFYILMLFPNMPKPYRDQLACSYFVWVLVTRWLPYILCSFCLIHEMRLSGAEIAAKNRSEKIDEAQAINPLAEDDRPSFVVDESHISKLISISRPASTKKSKDSSSLSRSLLASDEMSPNSARFFEDSYRGASSDTSSISGQIDNFGPPSFHDQSSAFARTYSLPGGNSFKFSPN